MSDDRDEDEDVRGGKKRKKDPPAPDKSTPDPKNPGLAGWIERLFRDDERADWLYVKQRLGRKGDVEGEVVHRYHFKPGEVPSKSACVAISNELMEEMENEANQKRTLRMFVVEAQANLGGKVGERAVTVEPTRVLAKALAAGEDVDPDDPFRLSGADALLKRVETVLQDGRFYAEIQAQNFGGLTEIMMDLIKDARAENKELRLAWLDMAKQKVASDDHAAERRVLVMREEFVLEAKRKGVNFLAGILPGFVEKVTDGAVKPQGGRTAVSMTIESVLDSLTAAEKRAVFGSWTKEGTRESPGVLTEAQVRVIHALLNEEVPPESVDRLIQGPDAITPDQFVAISKVASMEKLLPLAGILEERRVKIASRNQLPPPAPKSEA